MGADEPVVLLVDDYSDQADQYADWLRDQYSVHTATSSEQAKEMLSDEVQILVMDQLLSGLGGGELMDTICDRELSCDVVLVSAVEPGYDVLEMGFDEYLVKPIGRADLRETMWRLQSRDGTWTKGSSACDSRGTSD